MAVGDTQFESGGKSVRVTLSHDVEAAQVAYVEGWVGITARKGSSDDDVALAIDRVEYQFVVPAGLAVSKGDIVRLNLAEVTGHTFNDAAYNKSAASATNIDFFKATSDKDASNVVTGILIVA